jgi:ATP-binding cassette subfamily B protein IrtA
MAANWQRGMMRLMRIANHPVEVVSVEDLTPWYRRIGFYAPGLAPELDVFPTLWLRLWVPNPARGAEALKQRGYTFVRIDAESRTFHLDFVLHEVSGPAGDWARHARVGDRTEVALTPARVDVPDGTNTLVLAGDTTAFPAITTWLESVPPDIETRVFVEDDHVDCDLLPRVTRDRGTWEWVPREGARGAALARAIRASATPRGDMYAWAAGEKTLVKNVRQVIRDHLALDRRHHFSQFYWIEGKATG